MNHCAVCRQDWSGVHACNGAPDDVIALRQQLAERDARIAKLTEALRAFIEWTGPCDTENVDVTAWYERWADVFRRETGFLDPGKDAPPGLGGTEYEKQRSEAYHRWADAKWTAIRSNARAALSDPEPPREKP